MHLKRLFSIFLLLAVSLWDSRGQSDNFNSGTLDPAWRRSHFSPALVNLTFPDAGDGKALRIQASPVPDAAPAAALFYRDEVYTNFYLSLDVVDWPGTDKNQAIVLLARASLSNDPAATTGIIMNYDASQEGEAATDPRQGQLQINMVTNDPPFATKTIATAEVTLEPGRPYRFIFKGIGSQYTASIYDLHDLTQPLISVHADDVIQGSQSGGGDVIFDGGFTSGVCGFLSFSREGTTGTTDVTIDNYFAAEEDPNASASPALPHPVPGTPVVDTRVPAERFKNFHDPADGISFTVKTFTTNIINAAATKLRLNGSDLSSQLVLPANGASIAVSLPASALASNTVYNAQIEVEDVSGTLKSTNTFWFDTFSESFLSSDDIRTIEAEEYNFAGGQFQGDPIPVSGIATNGNFINGSGAGYWELMGVPEIDFHDASSFPENAWGGEFRSGDAVGLSAGIFPEIIDLDEPEGEPIRRSDNIRAKYADQGLLEYIVHRTEPGEWLNYTRTNWSGSHAVYLRVAAFGGTDVELHRVTSDPTQPDQTTSKLGTFHVPNMFTRYNYRYVPLVTDQGEPALIPLTGTETLRLQLAGTPSQDNRKIAMNYLLFVPQSLGSGFTVESSAVVDSGYALEPNAVFFFGSGRFELPTAGGTRFYRVRGTSATRLENVIVREGRISFEVRSAE